MNNFKISHPEETEYPSYFHPYIARVEGEDILIALKNQIEHTIEILSDIPDEKGTYRYEEGKWSINELVGHLIDTERIMAYRALRIARNDQTPLSGFEQDDYIENSEFDSCQLSNLTKEFEIVRASNIMMLNNLNEEAWNRVGMASDNLFSVKAAAYVLAGHELHHIDILRTRYL